MLEAIREITLGSWLTASFVIVIRLIFCKVLSPRAKYLLWLLVAVRLCMPILPESAVSVENLDIWQDFSQTVEYLAEETAKDLGISTAVKTVTTAEEKTSAPSPLLIWCVGMAVCFLTYALFTSVTFCRLKEAVPVEEQETLHTLVRVRGRLGISRDIRLCYGEETLIGGLRTPTLLIPRELSGEELDAALTHELMHFASGDLWIAAFWRILCCIYWFNPVVWVFAWLSRRDCEKACDQRVVALGAISTSAYAQLLYREGMMKRTVQIGTTAFGRSNLKARIKALAKLKKPAVWMTFIAVVLSLFVFVCSMTAEKTDHEPQRSLTTYKFFLHGSDYVFTEPGEQIVLKYTLQPVDAEIQWSTDDENVAYVNEYEVLTAVGPGICTLKAVSGSTTIETQVTCDFTIDVTDSAFVYDTLLWLLQVGDEDIINAIEDSQQQKSYKPVNEALKEKLGDIVRTDLSTSFYSGWGIGKLWQYGWKYGYTTTCETLTITRDAKDYRFGFEAVINISAGEETQRIPISGEVRYNLLQQITGIDINGEAIKDFYTALEVEDDA